VKISRKVLIESITNILKLGGFVHLINYRSNSLRLHPMMNCKKIMAKCLHNGIWSNYMYDLSVEGVEKCLKYVTIKQITGRQDVKFNPIGEESVVKFRSNLVKMRKP
jgi:hypothetical protein